MPAEIFETEFRLTSNGPQKVVAAYGAATTAATTATKAATSAQAALGKAIVPPVAPSVVGLRPGMGFNSNTSAAIRPPVTLRPGMGFTSTMGQAIHGPSPMAGIISGLAGAIPVAATIVGTFIAGATAVAGIVAGIAAVSLRAANQRDTIQRMLGDVFGGDLARGKKTYRDLQGYAKTSNFGTDVNAEGAVKLIGAGLPWEKYLKIAEKFAGGQAQKLDQMVGAITRANSGGLGEAAESLRDLGIGRKQLEGEGLKYDKSGAIKSSPEEFLAALERLAAKRGNLAGTGNEARIGNVLDSLNTTISDLGTVLSQSLLVKFEAFGTALDDLNQTGVIEQVGDAFNGLVDAITGDGSNLGDVFFDLGVQTATFFDYLTVTTGAVKGLGEGIGNVLRVLAIVGFGSKGAEVAGKVFPNGVRGAVAGAGMELGFENLPDREKIAIANRERRRQAREKEALMESQRKALGIGDMPGKANAPKADDQKSMAVDLRRIAENTGKQLDLSERLLGGGSVSKAAFSEASIGRMMGGDKRQQIVLLLEDLFGDIVARNLRASARY